MATVACTLQRTSDLILRKISDKLLSGELDLLGYQTVNGDNVFCSNSLLNRAMITIVVIDIGNEARSLEP